MKTAILGSNLSNKCVKKIFFREFSLINGIESSPNIGSIKLRTNLKHKVYVTNVALLIRYITSFENKQQLEDHWSCSSPERLLHCKLMRFKLIENLPMKVYAWTLLTPGAWPNLTQGHDWHNL